MTSETETRHPNWIPVQPGDILKGDRYRTEYRNGRAWEGVAERDRQVQDATSGAAHFIWPRPEKKPYEAIPEGRENAKVMAVSVDDRPPVVWTYYRVGARVYGIDPEGGAHYVPDIGHVTSAVHMTVVPTEALEALKAAWLSWVDAGASLREVADATDAFLAAVDGFGA